MAPSILPALLALGALAGTTQAKPLASHRYPLSLVENTSQKARWTVWVDDNLPVGVIRFYRDSVLAGTIKSSGERFTFDTGETGFKAISMEVCPSERLKKAGVNITLAFAPTSLDGNLEPVARVNLKASYSAVDDKLEDPKVDVRKASPRVEILEDNFQRVGGGSVFVTFKD